MNVVQVVQNTEDMFSAFWVFIHLIIHNCFSHNRLQMQSQKLIKGFLKFH